ncbi:MAG: ATP-binding protein [Eubacteriales bacterium]|nr:ATP-binding protein [Eubacteriales bacterium]
MLTKFKVSGFKGFENELCFDLSAGNFEFNQDVVRSNYVDKAIIYGVNGCGKSSLGLAIFDLILHLTDKQKMFENYHVYLNQNGAEKASFEYTFLLNGKELIYRYEKKDVQILLNEHLFIDGKEVVFYDFEKEDGFSVLDGTQTLRFDSPDSKLSKLKFIYNNAILCDDEINNVFLAFMEFVNEMLLFYSLDEKRFQGLMLGSESIDHGIVSAGKLHEFEKFLHRAGIQEKLVSADINGIKTIFFQYKKGNIPLQIAASTGTKSLELFYYWYIKMSKASFVFMDEFDAFYHYELSELIVRELINLTGVQVIFTTHNTDLLSNDILRPDCYFLMNHEKITSVADSTRKEIRKAHNIQKMYKAGAFDES